MKTQSKYINRKVINSDVSDKSPNKIGVVTNCQRFLKLKICLYTIQFRDYKEWWSLSYMKLCLVNPR